MANELEFGWDAKFFWFLKTINFYQNNDLLSLSKLPATDYPHLGVYIWSFFWKFPFNAYVLEETAKLGVLQLLTPVLAYAGFAISQMEVDLFKKSGFKIAIVAVLTFTGTFIGSAMIAQAML